MTAAKRKTAKAAADYIVKDIGLAEFGRKEISPSPRPRCPA